MLGLSLWRLTSLQKLLEGRIVAKRIEIRILFRVLAEPFGKVDRLLEVRHCGRAVAGQALQAREVVEQQSVLRSLGHERTKLRRHFGVLPGLVPLPQRVPELPADRLVRLARRRADRDHSGSRLFRERSPPDARRGEHERALPRLLPLAVELEDRPAPGHDVELLVSGIFLVLVDQPIARRLGRPGVHTERGDAEVMTDGPYRALTDRLELADVVDVIDRPVSHLLPPLFAPVGGTLGEPALKAVHRRRFAPAGRSARRSGTRGS